MASQNLDAALRSWEEGAPTVMYDGMVRLRDQRVDWTMNDWARDRNLMASVVFFRAPLRSG